MSIEQARKNITVTVEWSEADGAYVARHDAVGWAHGDTPSEALRAFAAALEIDEMLEASAEARQAKETT